MAGNDPTLLLVVGTSTILLFLGFVVILMVINNSRHIRHRAELAELHAAREREVIRAEREATQQTLREIGRELHDNVGQLLTVAQLGMNTALDERADARLAAARDALDQGIEEVRRLGHDLNSDLWQHRSLVDAISTEAERLERVGRVSAHVVVKGTPPALPPDKSTILYRVFQEVVNNALKHSGADTITIVVESGPPLAITITDNGSGFDTAHVDTHAGLMTIGKRCALIGFEATCDTAPGRGCTWHLQQHPTHGA